MSFVEECVNSASSAEILQNMQASSSTAFTTKLLLAQDSTLSESSTTDRYYHIIEQLSALRQSVRYRTMVEMRVRANLVQTDLLHVPDLDDSYSNAHNTASFSCANCRDPVYSVSTIVSTPPCASSSVFPLLSTLAHTLDLQPMQDMSYHTIPQEGHVQEKPPYPLLCDVCLLAEGASAAAQLEQARRQFEARATMLAASIASGEVALSVLGVAEFPDCVALSLPHSGPSPSALVDALRHRVEAAAWLATRAPAVFPLQALVQAHGGLYYCVQREVTTSPTPPPVVFDPRLDSQGTGAFSIDGPAALALEELAAALGQPLEGAREAALAEGELRRALWARDAARAATTAIADVDLDTDASIDTLVDAWPLGEQQADAKGEASDEHASALDDLRAATHAARELLAASLTELAARVGAVWVPGSSESTPGPRSSGQLCVLAPEALLAPPLATPDIPPALTSGDSEAPSPMASLLLRSVVAAQALAGSVFRPPQLLARVGDAAVLFAAAPHALQQHLVAAAVAELEGPHVPTHADDVVALLRHLGLREAALGQIARHTTSYHVFRLCVAAMVTRAAQRVWEAGAAELHARSVERGLVGGRVDEQGDECRCAVPAPLGRHPQGDSCLPPLLHAAMQQDRPLALEAGVALLRGDRAAGACGRCLRLLPGAEHRSGQHDNVDEAGDEVASARAALWCATAASFLSDLAAAGAGTRSGPALDGHLTHGLADSLWASSLRDDARTHYGFDLLHDACSWKRGHLTAESTGAGATSGVAASSAPPKPSVPVCPRAHVDLAAVVPAVAELIGLRLADSAIAAMRVRNPWVDAFPGDATDVRASPMPPKARVGSSRAMPPHAVLAVLPTCAATAPSLDVALLATELSTPAAAPRLLSSIDPIAGRLARTLAAPPRKGSVSTSVSASDSVGEAQLRYVPVSRAVLDAVREGRPYQGMSAASLRVMLRSLVQAGRQTWPSDTLPVLSRSLATLFPPRPTGSLRRLALFPPVSSSQFQQQQAHPVLARDPAEDVSAAPSGTSPLVSPREWQALLRFQTSLPPPPSTLGLPAVAHVADLWDGLTAQASAAASSLQRRAKKAVAAAGQVEALSRALRLQCRSYRPQSAPVDVVVSDEDTEKLLTAYRRVRDHMQAKRADTALETADEGSASTSSLPRESDPSYASVALLVQLTAREHCLAVHLAARRGLPSPSGTEQSELMVLLALPWLTQVPFPKAVPPMALTGPLKTSPLDRRARATVVSHLGCVLAQLLLVTEAATAAVAASARPAPSPEDSFAPVLSAADTVLLRILHHFTDTLASAAAAAPVPASLVAVALERALPDAVIRKLPHQAALLATAAAVLAAAAYDPALLPALAAAFVYHRVCEVLAAAAASQEGLSAADPDHAVLSLLAAQALSLAARTQTLEISIAASGMGLPPGIPRARPSSHAARLASLLGPSLPRAPLPLARLFLALEYPADDAVLPPSHPAHHLHALEAAASSPFGDAGTADKPASADMRAASQLDLFSHWMLATAPDRDSAWTQEAVLTGPVAPVDIAAVQPRLCPAPLRIVGAHAAGLTLELASAVDRLVRARADADDAHRALAQALQHPFALPLVRDGAGAEAADTPPIDWEVLERAAAGTSATPPPSRAGPGALALAHTWYMRALPAQELRALLSARLAWLHAAQRPEAAQAEHLAYGEEHAGPRLWDPRRNIYLFFCAGQAGWAGLLGARARCEALLEKEG